MKFKFIAFSLTCFSLAALAGLPAPGALPKNGNCPSDYVVKANECEPAKNAKFAVVKSGDCPADYQADGNYCVASADAKLAIRRAAMTCPKGFTPIGDYCVAEN